MRRGWRIALWIGAGVIGLVLLVLVAGVSILRSAWFHDKLRAAVVEEVETATGGKVEIASLEMDWRSLTVYVRGLTVHGKEPTDGPPLFHADEVVLGLKIVSLIRRQVDLAQMRVEAPRVLLLIAVDGSTNVPSPKTHRAAGKDPVATILDMAIQRFELNHGAIDLRAAGQKPKVTPYSARGDNLRSLVTFDTAAKRYHGDIEMRPLRVQYGSLGAVDTNINATLDLEHDRVLIETAHVAGMGSDVVVTGEVLHFASPVTTLEYHAKADLEKLRAVYPMHIRIGGWIESTGTVRFVAASDWSLAGPVKASGVTVRDSGYAVSGGRVEGRLEAGPSGAKVNDLRASTLGGQFAGRAWTNDWRRIEVKGDARGFDAASMVRLATSYPVPWNGRVSGPVEFAGGHGPMLAKAQLTITPADKGVPVSGFLDGTYDGGKGSLTVGPSYLQLPNSRVDASGSLGGQLQVKATTHDLNDATPLIGSKLPVTVANATFTGTVTGKLSDPSIAGHLDAQGVAYQGQTFDAGSADFTLTRAALAVRGGRVKQRDVSATVSGTLGLMDWKVIDASALDASIGLRNEGLAQLVALAGRKDLPLSGTVNLDARVTGTIGNPQSTADATVSKGAAWEEPFDKITAHLVAPSKTTQTATLTVQSGARRLDANATYTHGADAAFPGKLAFHATSTDMELRNIEAVHARSPDLSGIVHVGADGVVDIERDKVRLTQLRADLTGRGLQVGGRSLGDVDLNAATKGASEVEVQLRSRVAGASLNGDGQWSLEGDYPGSAKLTFQGLNIDVARRFLLSPSMAEKVKFGGLIEGTLNVEGPLAKPAELRAELEVPKLEVRALPGVAKKAGLPDVALRNDGPLRVRLANNIVRVDSMKFKAQDSAFAVTGRVTLGDTPNIDLRMDGSAELRILELVDSEIISSGHATVNASFRGPLTQPQLTGQVTLKNANLALANLPNGLSNANGTVLFNGDRATVQTFTAESGGGKVKVGGFASLTGGNLTYRLNAEATGVRVRYPEGVSTVADAALTWVGNSEHSLLSGTISVQRLAFNPKTDLGSLLSSSGEPVQTLSSETGLVSGMQFDVQIDTSPDITFQSGLTEGIEADASLKLRGTLSNPVLLGRMNITQGDLTFFGNKYVINQGSISFYNPVKLEPILNIDLETRARGVDVTLTVSGPVNKLNVSYRSDPPLEFSDIVALLATGRAPQDATLAAREPTGQNQNWQQMGASALLGQTIANPVAGRLQRFFGVSKLKIDPMLSGITGTPQAKLTIEQQISPDITFTYITNVADAQQQVVRVEWSISRTWSVVALRDSNGQFGMDFLYKKRFK